MTDSVQTTPYSYNGGVVKVWTEAADDMHAHSLLNLKEKTLDGDWEIPLNKEELVQKVALPFFYWSSQNRAHVPTHFNVLNYGAKRIDGQSPDAQGWLIIPLNQMQAGLTNWQKVAKASLAIQKIIEKREGRKSTLFKLFVPLSTRTMSDVAKSLFPCTGMGRDSLQEKSITDKLPQFLMGTVMLIADMASIAFRLLALPLRAIYQHFLQKGQLPQGVSVEKTNGTGQLNWGEGLLYIHGVERVSRSEGEDNYLIKKKLAIYLGS